MTKVIGKAKREDEEWLYIDVGVFNGLMESVGGIKYSYIVENSNQARSKKLLDYWQAQAVTALT